jgi:quinoprotein glucose dehydrogenase
VNCAVCHGQNLEGNVPGTYPRLKPLSEKFNKEEILKLFREGKGFMPSFNHLSAQEKEALAAFLLNTEETPDKIKDNDVPKDPHMTGIEKNKNGIPYTHTGYNRFMDKKGYPAIQPPWGTLTAIDLNEGTIKWQVPLGEFEELTKKGIPVTGTENYGGPAITAGGLLFIGASKDCYFRVFDKDTGKELWKHRLPAGGYATPSVYEAGGKQFVVIACGGGKMGTPSGDSYVAFTLGPDPR